MPRRRPQQSETDREWLARRAVIAVAGEIAHNAGAWLLDARQVADVLGCTPKHVGDLKKASQPINGQPPLTGWVHHGRSDKLPADTLASYITELEEVA